MSSQDFDNTFDNTFEANRYHFDELQRIAETTFHSWRGVGSYLMNGSDLAYEPAMLEKQRLFFQAAKNKKQMLEIGVHAAHSLLIALIANEDLKIDCIDICHWDHTERCVQYLNKHFANRITLHKGDSLRVLPHVLENNASFDMIHIDGDHNVAYVKKEYELIKDHIDRQNDAAIIFDDVDTPELKEYLDATFGPENVIIPDCKWANSLIKLNSKF
jgi:Methyltransferase domain